MSRAAAVIRSTGPLSSNTRWSVIALSLAMSVGVSFDTAAAHSISTVSIELIAPASGEAILPGDRITVRLRVGFKGGVPERDLVAVISSPLVPTRMVPVDADPDAEDATADVDIEAPYFDDSNAGRRRLPLTFRIAHRTDTRLVTRATKTFQLTVTLPQGAEAKPHVSAQEPHQALTDAPEAEPVGIVDPPLKALAVAPARIEETSLLPGDSLKPSPAYWNAIKGRIDEQIREHRPAGVPPASQASPTLHFRLFANGSAQSIRLEPGTGDSTLDQILLQSVIDAQPFPPFPAEVTVPHLDVHLAMPALPTRTK